MTTEEIAWDLSELFSGHDDPKIDKIMDQLNNTVEKFIHDYRGKMKAPEFKTKDLLELFEKQEAFYANMDELETYSHILFDANMKISESEVLKNKIMRFSTDVNKKLAFLELEVSKYVFDNKKIVDDPLLKNYRHYLKSTLRAHPHLLSEIEEQLILEKDQYGIREWSQLQSRWLNTRDYKVMVEGKEKILSYGEANALLSHPDRETRISAQKSIYSKLGEDEYIFSTALRNICSDWMNIVERRKFDNALHSSLIINDSTQEIIENLENTVAKNANVYRRYLKIKAKLLKLPKLNYADVAAPLLDAPNKKYSWEETKNLILDAYGGFDKEFADYAKDMFERNHIDGSIRMGKRNGAYCSGWFKGKSAFILLSYSGQLNEIYTLAHELGHAVHDYLAMQNQTFINIHPGFTVAETASIFGELLLTDLLLETSESNSLKKSVLDEVLDGAGMAAFQVSARYFFEQSLYDSIGNKEFLDGQSISKLWVAGRDKIYGDSIDFFEELDWEWAMKGHYFIPNFRFYNYPYVYAQLFVYALYQVYKKEGKEFVPKFKKLLSAGGSLSSEDLAKIVGLDITKPDFWELGIKQYEDFVNKLEELVE